MDELVLKCKHIQRISNLGKLTGLRKLCLSDNEITKIEGLESCEALLELSLEVRLTPRSMFSQQCFMNTAMIATCSGQ